MSRIRIVRTALTALSALAAVAAILACLLVAAPNATAAAASTGAPAVVIDHVAFDHLPVGLGNSSNFRYHFDRVDFVARVWESGSDRDGWRVDLDIDVMRGARLSDAVSVHDWFIGYEQRSDHPHYMPVRVHGHPGWLCRDQLFWLVRPGLAVSVKIDASRWGTWDAVRTARSAHLPGT